MTCVIYLKNVPLLRVADTVFPNCPGCEFWHRNTKIWALALSEVAAWESDGRTVTTSQHGTRTEKQAKPLPGRPTSNTGTKPELSAFRNIKIFPSAITNHTAGRSLRGFSRFWGAPAFWELFAEFPHRQERQVGTRCLIIFVCLS